MATTSTVNPYRNTKQSEKASKLAPYLVSVGITAAQMEHATLQEWNMAAHLANVNPSKEIGGTQARTLELMRYMETRR
jgi:hypothetical protein